jgi:hypothetical protein
MTKVITNRRAGHCFRCSTPVAAGDGFAFTHGRGWAVSCKSTQCLSADDALLAEAKALASPVGRTLDANGAITFPSRPTNDELVLVRSLPGARWNPTAKAWTVSTAAEDRARVLEVADRLKLEVAPEFRVVHDDVFATLVRDALDRASRPSVSGHHVYKFQYDGVKFLAGREGALIGDDMGVGKTIQALVALPEDAAALVIAPASLKWNWADECAEWRPDLKVVVCKGRNGWSDPRPGTLTIINYDILPSFLTPVKTGEKDSRGRDKYAPLNVPASTREALSNAVVICDEIQKAKNYKAARSKKVTTVCELAAVVWAATGTPLMNRPLDLWGTLSSIGLNWKVFGSWGTFLRCFGGFKNRWGGYEFSGPSGAETAERLRRVMLRRTKAEVLPDLPGKTWKYLRVNGLSKKIYAELDKLYKEWGGKDRLPPFEEFSSIRAEIATSRIPAVIEFVESYEEAGEPLVVFSAHRAPVEALGEREGWEKIYGDTDPQKRRDIIKRFQAGELKGVALTITAGGEGVTLTAASNMLYVDLDWTPALNDQAADRICRIGQKAAGLNYTVMVSDHDLDKHVTDLLLGKRKVIATAIDGVCTSPELGTLEARPGIELNEETEEEWIERVAGLEEAERERQAQAILDKIEHNDWLGRELGKANKAKVNADLPLTAERKAAVVEGLFSLLSVCDGARSKDKLGFNKVDAKLARILAATGLQDDYSIKVAQLIVGRYHRQLGDRFPILFA